MENLVVVGGESRDVEFSNGSVSSASFTTASSPARKITGLRPRLWMARWMNLVTIFFLDEESLRRSPTWMFPPNGFNTL